MPTIDEELLAYQEELERQKQVERQRRQRAQQLLKQELKRRTGQVAGKAAKKAAVAGARVAISAITSVISSIAAAIAPYLATVLLVVGIVILVIIVLTAMCNSSGFTGRLAQLSSGALGLVTSKFDFCNSLNSFKPLVEVIDKGQLPFCTRPEVLAVQASPPVPYPKQTDPDLAKLISCINSIVVITKYYTFDESHDTCNYTRGEPICERCSHARYSCHYGGSSGTTGALAADYPVKGGLGVAVLQAAQVCSKQYGIPLKRATCENESSDAVFCNDPGATHVHISIAKCLSDQGPINTD